VTDVDEIARGLSRACLQRSAIAQICAAGSGGSDTRGISWRILAPLRRKGLCEPLHTAAGYREVGTVLGMTVVAHLSKDTDNG
jgi:hypothetical protein